MGEMGMMGQDLHPSQHITTQRHLQKAVLDADPTEHSVVQHQEQQAAPPPSAWHRPHYLLPLATLQSLVFLAGRLSGQPETDGDRMD